MADIYCASTGSNTAPYDTWAKAATTFATAIAAATGGDTIYCDQFTDSYGTDTTFTFAAGHIRVIGSNDKTNAPPQTEGTFTIEGSANGVDLSFNTTADGSYYFENVSFKTGSGATSASLNFATNSDATCVLQDCTFEIRSTSGAAAIVFGRSNASANSRIRTIGCTFTWGDAGQGLNIRGRFESVGDDFCGGATVPTILFEQSTGFSIIQVHGADLSDITGTLFGVAGAAPFAGQLYACKLGSGVTIAAASASEAEGEVFVHDCNAGDVHYTFAHYNYLGSTVISNSIYANTGASYDGTNKHSWVVASSANASFNRPYISPWIDVYHDGTSAITPSIEILRDGSSTAYQDDEVWGEWSYKGTSGSTKATIVNDRKTILGTAANQAAGALGASDWTGENATAWFGKLTPTSTITPAEIGHLRARIYVGEASTTVYVDPQHRTLS